MDLKLTMDPRWLLAYRIIEESMNRLDEKVSMITITVKSNERADQLVFKGIKLGEKRLRVK